MYGLHPAPPRLARKRQSARAWSRRFEGTIYAAAIVTYAIAGMAFKPLLNWIVGPAFIVAVVWMLGSLRRIRDGSPP